jgi:mRNA interferase MazF
MKRGEVWVAAGGKEYAGKPRPSVIVQDDQFDLTDSLTICPFTSDPTDAWQIRILIQPTGQNGLRHPSRLMVDKVMTMRKEKFNRRIGALGSEDMARLDNALVIFLGLAG